MPCTSRVPSCSTTSYRYSVSFADIHIYACTYTFDRTMSFVDLTSSDTEDYLVDNTPEADTTSTDTAPHTDIPLPDSQHFVTPDYRRGIGGWIEESDPEEETQSAYPHVSDDDDTPPIPDDMGNHHMAIPAEMPHETPSAFDREPSFRTFRLFPGGTRHAYTPRKRVRQPAAPIDLAPVPAPAVVADPEVSSEPIIPVAPVPEEPVVEAPAFESVTPRKRRRTSQARKRTYIPSLAGNLAHRDEEDDAETMALGGSDGRPLFSERAVLISHDSQLVSLGTRIRELEDRVEEAERGRLAAALARADAERRTEQRVTELDQRMRAAVAALAAAFPSSSS